MKENEIESVVSPEAGTANGDASQKGAVADGETFFKDKLIEKQVDSKSPSETNDVQWERIAKNVRKAAASPDDVEDWAIVVDDSPVYLAVVAGILKSLNLGVHVFRNPVAALKFLNEAKPQDIAKILIVFSDLDMPEMDGIDFFRELRKKPATGKIPFVLVSGSIEKKYLPRLSMNRPDGVVIKPFNGQLIVDHVMKATVARQRLSLKAAE